MKIFALLVLIACLIPALLQIRRRPYLLLNVGILFLPYLIVLDVVHAEKCD